MDILCRILVRLLLRDFWTESPGIYWWLRADQIHCVSISVQLFGTAISLVVRDRFSGNIWDSFSSSRASHFKSRCLKRCYSLSLARDWLDLPRPQNVKTFLRYLVSRVACSFLLFSHPTYQAESIQWLCRIRNIRACQLSLIQNSTFAEKTRVIPMTDMDE